MSLYRTYGNAEALPRVIPVFPLAGAMLLPGSQLPLNIFEPRYIEMIDDALKSHRLVGMIQPESDKQASQAVPRLAHVGCLGRLTQFVETPDGRYLITLSGILRFRPVGEPVVATAYRQCAVDYRDFAGDFEPWSGEELVDREPLLGAFRAFAVAKELPIDWDNVNEAPTGALVNAFAAMGPFGLQEKQALLEAPDLLSRAEILIAAVRFELARTGGGRSLQ